jgi:hypothetical protein
MNLPIENTSGVADGMGSLLEEMRVRSYNETAQYPFGRSFLLTYLDRLQQFDSMELIAYCFRHWDHSEAKCLLCVLPELWEHWGIAEWRYLFSVVAPRPRPRLMFQDGYGDVGFFITYLHLNPFPLLMRSPAIAPADTLYIAEHLRVHAPVYVRGRAKYEAVPEEDRRDDEWTEYFAEIRAHEEWCRQRLAQIREALIAEDPDVQPGWQGVEGFRACASAVVEQMRALLDSSEMTNERDLSGIPAPEVLIRHTYRVGNDGEVAELE